MLLKKHRLLVTLLVAQLASSIYAQQTATPAPTPTPTRSDRQTQKPEDVDVVRITTNLVQVDAVVTDKSGKVVTDLKPEEVEIFEDGRKQKVTHFSYNVSETPAEERPAKPAPVEKVDKN